MIYACSRLQTIHLFMFLLYRVHSSVGCASPGPNPTDAIHSRTHPPSAESLYESMYYPVIRFTFHIRVLHKLHLYYIRYVTIRYIICTSYFLLYYYINFPGRQTIHIYTYTSFSSKLNIRAPLTFPL